MKVLILCNDFPPLNSVGAQRPYSWFIHLKKFGIEPTVVTKNWAGAISNRTDAVKISERKEIIKENSDSGKTIRVPVTTILPEKIMSVYGEHKFILLRKMLTFFFKTLSFISFRFDKHAGIYTAAKDLLQKESFDAIIVTGEPFILFRHGFLLSKKFGIPWIADYRDGWKINHVVVFQKNFLRRFLSWWEFLFEKKYIRTAKFILTVDPAIAKRLSVLLQKETEVIYNGFDEFYNYEYLNSAKSEKLILVHSGTLTPGQRAEFLVQAIRELNEENKITPFEIELRFIGIEYYVDQWNRLRSFNKDIDSYIVTTPRLPRESALKESAKADYLISFTEAGLDAIYAKTYDYLSLKKPILVLPDDHSFLSALVNDLKVGFVFSSIEELKKFLLEKIAIKKSGMLNTRIEETDIATTFYTREKQTQFLAEILKKRFGAKP